MKIFFMIYLVLNQYNQTPKVILGWCFVSIVQGFTLTKPCFECPPKKLAEQWISNKLKALCLCHNLNWYCRLFLDTGKLSYFNVLLSNHSLLTWCKFGISNIVFRSKIDIFVTSSESHIFGKIVVTNVLFLQTSR